MTAEAQLIAVSKVRGWYGFSHEAGPDGNPTLVALSDRHEPRRKEPVPDYLNDLNAMHEAEELLAEQYDAYRQNLRRVCQRDFSEGRLAIRHSECATAAQRAEAFLLTMGAWRG